MTTPPRHFLELRDKIHDKLRALRPPCWEEQIERYPWLYGALGNPSADVMFICENPSLTALRKIRESPWGGPPDIDTQWTGDPARRPDKRFRNVLRDLGLKDGEIWQPGGWHCYITNVIKQAAFVGDWKKAPQSAKQRTAREWSGVLQWELDEVKPSAVFCVGRSAEGMVKWLQSNAELRIPGPAHYILHYSARRGDEEVERRMRNGIKAAWIAPGYRSR
ncbi:MAG: uracil-DNA glycosylase family protein [Gemmatimonadetes bacterium]|nr:uracil-DNA glycosylase family protein [Gemmatimonadota bacterium]